MSSIYLADIKNTPKIKGVTIKFNHEKKKEYLADITAKINDQKNKMTVYPKVLIKTPTKDLLSVKGSVTGQPGSFIKVDLIVDKIFNIPITLKGKTIKILRKTLKLKSLRGRKYVFSQKCENIENY